MTAADPYDQDQPVPANLAAEDQVLGACMIAPEALDDCVDILIPEMFYRPANSELFGVLLRLRDRNEPTDPVAVANYLGREKIKQVGGAPHLHTLMAGVHTASNAAYHAEKVVDAYVRRAASAAATHIHQVIREGSDIPTEDLIEQLRNRINDLDSITRPNDGVYGSSLVMSEVMAEWNDPVPPGIPTGWYDLDDALAGGLRDSHFICIAARPGQGKTIMGCNIARHLASKGKQVLFFSLEMSRRELMTRMTADVAGVQLHKFHTRQFDDMDWQKIERAVKRMREWPEVLIIDEGTQRVAQIRAACRRQKRKLEGLDCVIIDYLGLITSENDRLSEYESTSRISRQLKLLAKELGVPVIAIHQLNRNPESRIGKKPQISDLRSSGQIEQDIDIGLLLYRDQEDEQKMWDLEVIIGKNRHGPMKTVTLLWQAEYARIGSLAREDRGQSWGDS